MNKSRKESSLREQDSKVSRVKKKSRDWEEKEKEKNKEAKEKSSCESLGLKVLRILWEEVMEEVACWGG